MGNEAADNPDDIWAEFFRLRGPYLALRERLLVSYLPFAHQLADRAHVRMPARVRRDEVRSEAQLGLVQAIDRYKGHVKFTTFAAHRVIGQIQDWARARLRHPEFSLNELMRGFDTEN